MKSECNNMHGERIKAVYGCFTFRAKTTLTKLETVILLCTSIQSKRQVYITNTFPCFDVHRSVYRNILL